MTICPVCNSANTALCFRVSAKSVAQSYVAQTGEFAVLGRLSDKISRLWGTDDCEVRECRDCTFGFAWPYVAGDGEFYNLTYPRARYRTDKWEYRRTYAALKGREPQRVLEIGAGVGHFLDGLKPLSPVVVCTEFNDTCVDVLCAKGYRVFLGDIREVQLEDDLAKFDAIFMFQVLEHLDDVHALFSRLSGLMSKDGRLFISVPNKNWTDFNEATGGLMDLPPAHIGRWTPKAVAHIAGNYGLSLKEWDVESFSFGAFAMQDIIFRYLRKAENAGSLANWSRKFRSGRLGIILNATVALSYAPARAIIWLQHRRRLSSLGSSLWLCLSRE